MINIKTISLMAFLLTGLQVSAFAQANDASTKLKKYINTMVHKVEKAEEPAQKRAIMNDSFDKMIKAFEKVGSMKHVSEEDRSGIAGLKSIITDKKDELNGLNGYDAVKNNQLNNFANYVQQDLEQADKEITISVTVLLLIIIILLLL